MGLAEQIYDVLAALPEYRQTALFSATLPTMLVDFAKAGLKEPELVRLDTEQQLSENMKVKFILFIHSFDEISVCMSSDFW
jgi:ATP-dependent RNA helicase DDX54/DBP10